MSKVYALLLLLAAGFSMHGQGLTSLNGVVTDSSGAVIARAEVSLENPATGLKRSALTDAAGLYAFPQMSPGTYQLKVSAAGFATAAVNDLVLLVNTPATIPVKLEVGAVSSTVAVTAESEQLNTTDASLGTAIGTQLITQLPFEARNVALLLALQPGVTYFGERDEFSGSVNGGKTDQANITLDGVDVNDQQERTAFKSVLRVTLDSTQEFRTTTLNATADQGRSSGAQVALVTKSGTNELHGSLYEYHRNTITTANSFLNNQIGVERPKLIRNVFGASVGGAAKKNKLFYFLNYEGRRDASEVNVTRRVPTASLRAGIVRYFDQAGDVQSLSPEKLKALDPAGLGVNQAVLDYFNKYPLPNGSSVGDGLNTSSYRFTAPVPLTFNTYIAKMDYNIDSAGNHTVFVRGNLQNDDFVDAADGSAPAQFPGQAPAVTTLDNSKGIAAGYTAVLRPNLVSTFRYGFTRQGTQHTGAQSAPVVSFRGLDDLNPQTRGLTRIIPVNQWSEDMAWTKGKHDVRFGGVIRTIRNGSANYATAYPNLEVTYSYLAGTARALQVPDLSSGFRTSYRIAAVDLLGPVSFSDVTYNYDKTGAQQALGSPVNRNFAVNEYEMYAQDTWHATRALTVTAGLRYSLSPAIHETNGNQVSPNQNLGDWFVKRGNLANAGLPQSDAGNLSFVLADAAGGAPIYDTPKLNFSPRLAIAYSPQSDSGWTKWLFGGPGKTVFRAGAGIFYDLFGQSLARSFDSNAPGLATELQSPATANLATVGRFTSANSTPDGLLPSAPKGGFPYTPDQEGFAIANSIDSHIKQPYSINLNFSIGREYRGGFFVQGSYVGRLSRRSLVTTDLAQPTNLKDPKSGITYWDAVNQLILLGRQNNGNGVDVSQVKPNAFWENLYPGAAGSGLTATQAMYQEFQNYPADITSGLLDIDIFCSPACSTAGPYAMFNSQYATLFGYRSTGKGDYHAMQWNVQKKFGNGSSFTLNYTWSKSIDLTSTAESLFADRSSGVLLNSYNAALSRGLSDYDVTHSVTAYGVYQLPFGRGQRFMGHVNKGVNAVLGGWQVSGVWTQTSGILTKVLNGGAWPTNWDFSGFASQTSTVPPTGTDKNASGVDGVSSPNLFANPLGASTAYSPTLAGQIGQRNGLRGDGYLSVDMSLSKRFVMPFSEKQSLQFRWEVFNVPNTVRFDPRTASLSLADTGSFGKYNDQLGDPRVMQFGLRYEF